MLCIVFIHIHESLVISFGFSLCLFLGFQLPHFPCSISLCFSPSRIEKCDEASKWQAGVKMKATGIPAERLWVLTERSPIESRSPTLQPPRPPTSFFQTAKLTISEN